ncbi:IclR family transcriptional regulator [Aureimonas fodinaquatilis]|uniref:IclR family transcriptional regulator n=1 Tax=Aureimonas fodinaquatilis TaxID=2565783 RepID=UPI001AED7FB3|nr:IclR family transcriptional regulator [Aureimonas fodinaquatilis]
MQKNKTDHVDGLFNQSLEKGLAVLLAFSPEREAMNLSEIAVGAGISKSAAQRFAHTLETLGYLHKDPSTKRYSLTVATLALGYRYLLVNRTIERANPFLLDLNRACRETVNYSEPDGAEMVYVGRFPTSLTTPVHMPLGRRLPIFCTSAGRAYLSCLPVDERRSILQSSDRVAHTRKTITDVEALLTLCQEASEEGYAYADGEFYTGDLNVSAPVLQSGRVVGAITISAPATRWTIERLREELAPMVMETARQVSTQTPELDQLEPFRLGSGKV